MTPGCNAVMKAVNVGNKEEAYLRSLPTSLPHISVDCVRCGITFDRTKYIESKFTVQGFAEWVFSEPDSNHKGTTGTNTKRIGG